jgi:hypothetical protein
LYPTFTRTCYIHPQLSVPPSITLSSTSSLFCTRSTNPSPCKPHTLMPFSVTGLDGRASVGVGHPQVDALCPDQEGACVPPQSVGWRCSTNRHGACMFVFVSMYIYTHVQPQKLQPFSAPSSFFPKAVLDQSIRLDSRTPKPEILIPTPSTPKP